MNEVKNIIFFNNFHNGDLHVSREFVRQICNKLKNKYNISYAHHYDFSALKDLEITQVKFNTVIKQDDIKRGHFIRGDTLYINTWYGQDEMKFMMNNGTSFSCLCLIFEDLCDARFDFSLSDMNEDISKFFPTINYSYYETENIDKFINSKKNRKRILVSNGDVLSGQALNWPFSPIIEKLAEQYSDIDFILSNKTNGFVPKHNLFASTDIIQKGSNDLNENSYLSTFCDIIIGRWSGAYTYSMTQHNFFEREVIFLCYLAYSHNLIRHKWLGTIPLPKIIENIREYKADILGSTSSDENIIYNEIDVLCKRILK